MKMKKSISLLVILCIAATMLTACGKSSGKRTLSVSFPKTARATNQGTETITTYSHDRVIVHDHMTESSSMMTAILRFAEQCKAGMKNIVCSGSIRRRESQWEAV